MRPLAPYELSNIRKHASMQDNARLNMRIHNRAKRRKLHEDLRAQLVDTVVVILKQGYPTLFEHEGTCRHSVRSFLCVEGWGWDEADISSADIVLTALNRIGAKRPTWSQGQPEYRGEEFHGTLRRCMNPRCRSILEGSNRIFCSEHCGDVVRKKRYEDANKARLIAMKLVYQQRKRQADPEAYRQWQRESTARSLEKHEPRQCVECGKYFKAFPSDPARYCSVDCRHAKNRVNIMRPCATCGTEFSVTKKSDGRKYCSMKCNYERNIADKTRDCLVCKTQFQVWRPSKRQKTCSRKCGVALGRYGPKAFQCEAV